MIGREEVSEEVSEEGDNNARTLGWVGGGVKGEKGGSGSISGILGETGVKEPIVVGV